MPRQRYTLALTQEEMIMLRNWGTSNHGAEYEDYLIDTFGGESRQFHVFTTMTEKVHRLANAAEADKVKASLSDTVIVKGDQVQFVEVGPSRKPVSMDFACE